MKPFEKSIAVLEFDKILEKLASLCCVEAGKEKILTLRPEKERDRVIYLQKQTAAAKRISATA